MSSGIHDLYIMFFNAVHNLASSSVEVTCIQRSSTFGKMPLSTVSSKYQVDASKWFIMNSTSVCGLGVYVIHIST